MGTITSAARLRHDLSARLDDARARTDELFAIVRNESMYDRPIYEALSKPDKGHPQLKTMLEVAVEHRLMHAETLAYMLHRLPSEKKLGDRIIRKPAKPRVKPDLVEIPAGHATLGLVKETGDEFGWDNEMDAHDVDVPALSIEKCNVTNGDYLRFIQAGGYK